MTTPAIEAGGAHSCARLSPIDPQTRSPLLTVEEAARFLRLSKSTLAKMRMGLRGRYGPAYVKVGKRVFYPLENLQAFIQAKLTTHTGAPAGRC